MTPIRKRKFDAFLSYSSRDRELAKRLYQWLKHVAGLNIWFDQEFFPPGQEIVKGLLGEMDQCRGVIVLATEAAADSDHVLAEFEHARLTRKEEPNFAFVILTPDVTNLPAPFKTASSRYTCSELHDGWLDVHGAINLLGAIGGLSNRPFESHHELFVSRSENRGEREHADAVCSVFSEARLGLVADVIGGGDWRQRIRALMSEVHGHLVVLPAQALEEQANYLEEIRIAEEFDLPLFVCAHPDAGVPDAIRQSPYFVIWDGKADCPAELERAIERFQRNLKPAAAPAEAFYACQYRGQRERNDEMRSIIERITSRRCRLGHEHQVFRPDLTSQLVEQIRSARLVVADVASTTDENGLPVVNLNTCIEAGIAIGANRALVVLVNGKEDTGGKTETLPFMLRNCQIIYYADEVELVGKLYRALASFRRRLMNR